MKPKRLLVLGVLLVGVTAATSLIAAQKPAPPQPTEQQKLKERLDALDSQLKEAQAKADRAVMEKEYIERIQKEAKDYYDKAFLTQLAIVTIIGLFVAAAGKFGVDHIVQSKLTEASAKLRDEFTKNLDERFRQLEESNEGRLQLLKEGVESTINELAKDVRIRSDYHFFFLRGLAFSIGGKHDTAVGYFGAAIQKYKEGKPRSLFPRDIGTGALLNMFLAIQMLDAGKFLDNAKKELADPLYDGLDDELATAALKLEAIAPLIRDRIASLPSPAPAA